MKKHDPIYNTDKLSAAERTDLASITKHPGMFVLIEKIGQGHANQQLLQIMHVDVDDPERITKLAAISATAYSMKLFLDLLREELARNFKYLEEQETKNRMETSNA